MSAETESSVSPSALNLEKCSVVLLDVAGTTTSINFVKKTLFPYVIDKAEEFLKSHWEDDLVKESVKILKDSELDIADAVATVKELTGQNNNNKGLKSIQGLIYKEGYNSGDLKAHVFSDVPASFKAWTKSRKIAIYSTGSVESQQLLFSHTTEGDVSSHITKYFDQTIGSKTESQSYDKITKELNVEKEEIVFITDSVEEAKAAKTSGLLAVLVKREGNDSLPEESAKEFSVISSFKDIIFENPAKRKNKEETVPAEEQPPSKLAKKEGSNESPVAEISADVAVIPSQEAKKIETVVESMEVDSTVEKEEVAAEAKSTDKPTEATTGNEKTEIDSTEKKTDDKSESVNKDVEPKETMEVEETPMETSDGIDEVKDAIKQENTEENKEKTTEVKDENKIEPETDLKKIEEPVKEECKKEKTEKVESKAETAKVDTDTNEKDEVKESPCDKTKAEAPCKDEEMVTEVDEEVACNMKEKAVDTVKPTVINDVDANEDKKVNEIDNKPNIIEAKETVNSEPNVTEKDDESLSEEKEENKIVEKSAEIKENKIEASPKVAEEITNKDSKIEKPVEVSPVVEDEAKDVEETKSEENKSEDQSKTKEVVIEEKADNEVASSSESCPKEGKPSETTIEQENKDEKTTETESKGQQNIEEKENKSELANGIENGKTETEIAVNGESEEKPNDETKVAEADKVEEIKVKKAEASADNTPPVSVEV